MNDKLFNRALVFVVLVGCSEANDKPLTAPSGGADASTADGHVDSGGIDGGTVKSDASLGSVVVNEISGRGEEWIELYNAGTSSVDLGGFLLADSQKEGGAPKTSEALKFPTGTTLEPGGYLVAAKKDADGGLKCPTGGPPSCLGLDFGISNGSGEHLYVLDSTKTPVQEVDYPANTVPEGGTWARIPNGTGVFSVTRPTPGAKNEQ